MLVFKRNLGSVRNLTLTAMFGMFFAPCLTSAGDITYDQARSVKGGVSTLGRGAFVHLRSDHNEITLKEAACKDKQAVSKCRVSWVGKVSYEPQIVLTDGRRVSESVSGLDISHLIVVIFLPTEVRFIDLSRNVAAKFPREP